MIKPSSTVEEICHGAIAPVALSLARLRKSPQIFVIDETVTTILSGGHGERRLPGWTLSRVRDHIGSETSNQAAVLFTEPMLVRILPLRGQARVFAVVLEAVRRRDESGLLISD